MLDPYIYGGTLVPGLLERDLDHDCIFSSLEQIGLIKTAVWVLRYVEVLGHLRGWAEKSGDSLGNFFWRFEYFCCATQSQAAQSDRRFWSAFQIAPPNPVALAGDADNIVLLSEVDRGGVLLPAFPSGEVDQQCVFTHHPV